MKRALARARPVTFLISVTVVWMLGAAGCSDAGPEVAARLVVDGRAEVGAPGDNVDDVSGERSVRFGQRVRVREGTAVIDLRGKGILELRPGSHIELGSVQVDGARIVVTSLLAGDVLATAADEPVRVSASGTEVTVRGTARLSKGLSLAVGTYAGTVELASAGSAARIDSLRQMDVPAAGLFPARPSPLQYVASDAWDRRLLGDAIELSNELLARSQGFSAQVTEQDRGVDFFRALLPGLASESAFEPSLLGPPRSAGETLVGAAIALQSTRGTFTQRWESVFRFREDGAQWGLVALDHGVARAPLLAEVDAAIGRGPAIFGVPLPTDPGLSPPPGTSGTGTRPPGNGQPGGGPTVPTVPGSTVSTVPGQVPPPQPVGPGPINTGLPAVDTTANSLVETLSGLLRALGLS